jgi:quinol monooxygenase YgiN
MSETHENLKTIRFEGEMLPKWAQLLDLAARLCPIPQETRSWFSRFTRSSGVDDARTVVAQSEILRSAIQENKNAIIAELQKNPHDADEVVDHTPAHHWPDPLVTGEPSLEAGPIMVQVEYTVDPPRANAFRSAMADLGRNRRRDGAVRWWLFQDTADPSRFVETWIEETWAEHLRNHERVSVADQEIEQRVRELTRSGSTIATRHFIAPEPRPLTDAMIRAVEERTRG